MTTVFILLTIISLLLTAQALYSAALMLYAWEDTNKRERGQIPATFEAPQQSFTLLLPARHEEEVIQDTIQRTVDLNYPPELVQIPVVIEAGDSGTIAEDEPHRDILNVVNTLMVREGSQVVQCGVQLMNYADRWFSALNVWMVGDGSVASRWAAYAPSSLAKLSLGSMLLKCNRRSVV